MIDPGVDAAPVVEQMTAQHHLDPVAVLLTHGHIDHVAGAAALADPRGITVHCPPADVLLLTDPGAALDETGRAWVRQRWGTDHLAAPHSVRALEPGSHHLAGLELDVVAAPGHTPGSSLIRLPDTEQGPIVFSGDVIFAGTVGRTDLPGGDADVMAATLAEVVWPLDDDTHLLPGHGPATTMDQERRTNPYLQGLG